MNTFPMSETAENVVALLNRHMMLFDSFCDVYLFGSILDSRNDSPRDIDILLVYAIQFDNIVSAVKTIRSTLEKQIEMSMDLTVLSLAEEQEVRFLERLDSSYFKVK